METVDFDRATPSDGHGPMDEHCPTRTRILGGLFVVLGAAFCGLALLTLIASPTGRPASAPIAETSSAPQPGRPIPIPTPIPETERRIEEALAKPFPATAGIPAKVSLSEATARFSKLLPVPVDLDSKSLNDANVDTSTEVEFPAGERTVGQVLEHILAEPSTRLTWAVVHGAFCIMTVDQANEATDMRAYDVSDLVEPVVTTEGAESWDSKELIEALEISFESLADGMDKMSCVNANGRTILIARLSRRAHQDLVTALAKIREQVHRGTQPGPSRRRRVVQTAKVQRPRHVAALDVAALQSLMTPSESMTTTTNATCNAFTLDLYRKLATEKSGNTVVCPFGLYVVLALLKEAASGETDRQIAHVLHADQKDGDLQRVLPGLTARLDAINLVPDYQLSVASRAWCDDAVPVPKDLGAALRDRCQVEIEAVPFLSRPGDAEHLINYWVKEATDGRITEIIDSGEVVASKIDFAVTNAVSFRGLWAEPFDRQRTLRAPFHAGGKTFDVVMMRSETKEFPVAEVEGADLLELPYRGGLMSALILLPADSPGALERMEASLSIEKLSQYRKALSRDFLKVELPRFEIHSDFRLEQPLKSLGLTGAFVPTGDFYKLGRPEWHLAYVRQKALIKVDEEGTEASAATMGGGAFGGVRKKHLFRADHPFLFLIEEKSTGLILFVARVTDPERSPF
jgi:serine protease inhibitor